MTGQCDKSSLGRSGINREGGTVNPPRNRKGGAGNPPPTGARASALPDIGWLKVVFAILVAIDISLVGWLAQNYDDAPIFLQIVCSVAAVVMTGGVVWINMVAYRKIDELEEL